MSTRFCACVCAALLGPSLARGHHSITAHYDPGDVRAITGTLESLKWANPHTEWVFAVRGESGEVQRWRAEGDAVNTMVRNGLTRDLFAIGTTVTVIGPVARGGKPEMIAARAVMAGREFEIFPALADELDEDLPPTSVDTLTSAAGYVVSYAPAPDLFRVWTPVDFPATAVRPQELQLTDTARASLATYDPVRDDLATQCVAAGMPSMLDQPYPIEFIDEGERIVMRVEEWNGRRTIHMTDAHPDESVGTIYGHSRGRWEDGALVIETRGMSYAYYNDVGVPMTRDARVTERYSLSADGRRMDWSVTTVDPAVFAGEAVLSGWAVWVPSIEIRPFECEAPAR